MYRDMAIHIALLRPNISLNRPYKGWNAVEVMRYAEGTQEMIDPALKAEAIVDNAVDCITESREVTTTQSDKAIKTVMICLKGKRFVWSVSCTVSGCRSFFVAVAVSDCRMTSGSGSGDDSLTERSGSVAGVLAIDNLYTNS